MDDRKERGNTTISVYVKTLHKANITYNVRHTEKAANTLVLTTNFSYFIVIQCWNHAGMTSHKYSTKDVCSTDVFNAGLGLQGTVRGFLPESQEHLFYGVVIVTNRAGLQTVVS